VDATVTVPGSKSIANRALVLAALSDGPARLDNLPLGARDIRLMIAALRSLGCQVTTSLSGAVTVRPDRLAGPTVVDCGLAGTVMRFVPPMAGLATGDVRFDGDPRARERPMRPLIQALRDSGVVVEDNGHGRLPFTIRGTGAVTGGTVRVDASGSSQFVSALLLSGSRFDAGILVGHRGRPVPSIPHIEMTCRMLADHGATVTTDVADRTDAQWRVEPGPLRPVSRLVEPDLSNAAPFLAAALVTGGRVVIRGWPTDSVQPSQQLLAVLQDMGGATRFVAEGLEVSGTGPIGAINADLRDVGELVPTITALCALADGPSRLTGIGHISGHETDRLTSLADQVNRLGGDVRASSDRLEIHPRRLRGGRWATYHDHRMATTGAIIGLVVPGVRVENIATTAKTFQQFPQVWSEMVGDNGQMTGQARADQG
jgi:3-phosphoshikimate 1-carboxyvinyltransferase